jgi:hypothetical protein
VNTTGGTNTTSIQSIDSANDTNDIGDNAKAAESVNPARQTDRTVRERDRPMCDDEYPSDLSGPEEVELLLSWEDACTAWLKDSGSTWPGGEKNRHLLTEKIISLELESAANKQGVLTIAFEALQTEHALVEPNED